MHLHSVPQGRGSALDSFFQQWLPVVLDESAGNPTRLAAIPSSPPPGRTSRRGETTSHRPTAEPSFIPAANDTDDRNRSDWRRRTWHTA